MRLDLHNCHQVKQPTKIIKIFFSYNEVKAKKKASFKLIEQGHLPELPTFSFI